MTLLKYLTPNEKKTIVYYWIFVLALFLFWMFAHYFWPSFDQQGMDYIRQAQGSLFSAMMTFVSWWGQSFEIILAPILVAIVFWFTSFKREALYTLFVFPAGVITVLIKLAVNRPRPEAMDIWPKFQQSSFPSGHVVDYVAFFGFLLAVMLVQSRIPRILRWVVGLFCVFLIAGVGVARVYLGTHWPMDVLMAYMVGFVMLGIIVPLYLIRSRAKPWT